MELNFVIERASLSTRILDQYDNGYLTETEKDILLEYVNNSEIFGDTFEEASSITDSILKNPKTAQASEKILGVADKYNSALNKGAEFVAKRIVKDPTKNGTVQVSSDVYEKYKKDMERWKAGLKVAEVVAIGAIAVGPLDTVLKIATVTAMTRSNDSTDKAAMEILNKLKEKTEKCKDKLKELGQKLKKKVINESQLKNELRSLETEGAAIAKQTDSAKEKIAKAKNVNESAYLIIDDIVLNEFGEVDDTTYKILNRLIEESDMSDGAVLDIVTHYTNF